jgi:hypothetical protein
MRWRVTMLIDWGVSRSVSGSRVALVDGASLV